MLAQKFTLLRGKHLSTDLKPRADQDIEGTEAKEIESVPDVYAQWTREKALEEYEALVSALQYTIGERERLKALLGLIEQNLGKASDELMARIVASFTTSPSERHQDMFALLFTRKFEGGFFVEFGACDGITASNTYTLERCFGWTGILSEPGKVWQQRLSVNRTARIDGRCITASTGSLVNFNEGLDPRVSSIDPSHKYLREVSNTYTVPTVSLTDLLRDHDAPQHIDFLCIDIEGGEYEALEGLDFGMHSFGFICIEQHDHISVERDVSDILRSAGYREIFPRSPDKTKPPHMQVAGIDLFFLPSHSPYFN